MGISLKLQQAKKELEKRVIHNKWSITTPVSAGPGMFAMRRSQSIFSNYRSVIVEDVISHPRKKLNDNLILKLERSLMEHFVFAHMDSA